MKKGKDLDITKWSVSSLKASVSVDKGTDVFVAYLLRRVDIAHSLLDLTTGHYTTLKNRKTNVSICVKV